MTDEHAEVGETTLVERRHFTFHPWWLASAAVVFLALWGWRELDVRRMRESIETEKAEVRALLEQNEQLAQRGDHMLAVVAAPETRTISLTGRAARGKIFVDPRSGHAIVVVSDLSPNGASKAYKLWITKANSDKPQGAAMFDVGPSGNATLTIENMPSAAEIKSFGVTLESRSGADAPTGEYLLAGKP